MIQLQALLLSLAVEAPIAVVGLSTAASSDVRRTVPVATALKLAIGVTLLTHPLAWSANAVLGRRGWPTLERLMLIELVVVLVEATIFARFAGVAQGRALAVAVIANLASFGAGLVVG